jgi:hypothetical protein
MKPDARRTPYPPAAGLGLLAVLLSALIGGRASLSAQSNGSRGLDIENAASAKPLEAVLQGWPKLTRSAAKAMIVKYGKPAHYGDDALVWLNNGPWLKTVVFRDAWTYLPGMKKTDVLEQTIAYEVPLDTIVFLRDFDKRITVDPASNELSVRSESEQMNDLALNLADEIIKGNRSVESARNFYSQTTRLAQAGKSSRYMNGLLFKGHPFMGKIYYP